MREISYKGKSYKSLTDLAIELKTEIQSSETYQKVVKILNKELDGYIAKQEKRKE